MKNKFNLFFKERILGEQVREVDKEKELITLLVWLGIMLVLFVTLRVSYQNNKNTEVEETPTKEVETKKNNPLKDSFSKLEDNYNYKIFVTNSLGEEIEKYDGIYSKGVNIGKKVVYDSILNYRIEGNIITNSNTESVIDDLYGTSLSYFFVPINVYEYVKDLDYIENSDDNNKIFTYNSIYDDISIEFKIVLDEDNIKEINYTYNGINYNIILS